MAESMRLTKSKKDYPSLIALVKCTLQEDTVGKTGQASDTPVPQTHTTTIPKNV